MSVLLETTLGELVVDVYAADAPLAATNFLKLCKKKYFNGALFFNVQENFMVQSGDPTGTGRGGQSLYGQLYGPQANFFADEVVAHRRHDRKGLVGMANSGPNTNASQFYITMRGEDLEYLDGKHTLFGEVAEGLDVLDAINQLYVDKDHRPFQDVRIKHTHVLDDPFPDPPLLEVPPESPQRERPDEEQVEPRLPADAALEDAADGRTEEELEASVRAKEAKSRAVVLEMIGDLPDADAKPPEEVLFVCKLNPVTESSDLDMAFCRFGPCKSEVIRDFKTGDSLCFAFVEFTDAKHCEEAYFKMNNVLLDDRRIKVDFSQSVSKLWNKFARRPWEKHSKSDGDPYAGERRGGKRDELFGRNRLRLKPSKHTGGADFDLVEEEEQEDDDGHGRRAAISSSSSHARRDRGGDSRRRDARRSPERHERHRDGRDKPRERRKSRSRERHESDARRRKRNSSRDAGDRDRKRERRSPSRERKASGRQHRDEKESSRRQDSRRSRSRSHRRDRESGRSR